MREIARSRRLSRHQNLCTATGIPSRLARPTHWHRQSTVVTGWEPRGDNRPAKGPSASYPARAPTNDGSFTAAPDGTFLTFRDSRDTAICESAANGNTRIDSLNCWRMIRAFWTGRGVASLLVTLCAFLKRIGRCAASPFGEVHAAHACMKGPNVGHWSGTVPSASLGLGRRMRKGRAN